MNAQNAESMLTNQYKNAVRQEFYRLINTHRKANMLRELEVNTDLEIYADIRAAEQRIRFGHTRPDGSPAGSGWYNSQNFMNTRFAENARSVTSLNPDPRITANEIFTAWRNSPGHNAHMLYDFSQHITMALGIAPELSGDRRSVTSGSIFATGYGVYMSNTEFRALLERPESEIRIAYPNGNLPDDYFERIGSTAYRVVRGNESPLDVVVIPATFNGLPVTEISARSGSSRTSAFGHRDNILVVYISEGVMSINFSSFWYNRGLVRIVIPASVTTINSSAFTGCSNLTSVTFAGTINANSFADNAFPGDLRSKYLAGGPGTYTRNADSNTWIKQ